LIFFLLIKFINRGEKKSSGGNIVESVGLKSIWLVILFLFSVLEHIVELESGHEQCLYLYNKSGLLNENWNKQRYSQRKYKQWKELDW
jgi:hypothetical protein